MAGTLYVVATPIGNLDDITLRALEVLQRVDCIACEDTRVTARLLRRHGIKKPLISYHEHNERERARQLIDRLLQGDSVALVTDAGTPALSDPGAYLVSSAASCGIPCVPVPGPSALCALLSVAGEIALPVTFVGFAPSRARQREKFLEELLQAGTYCFYESPHRIVALLRQLASLWDNPPAVVGRELTKLYEEILRGSAAELAAALEARPRLRGEFVLLAQRAPQAQAATPELSLRQEMERLLAAGEDRKSALRLLARSRGLARRELYRRLIEEGAEE